MNFNARDLVAQGATFVINHSGGKDSQFMVLDLLAQGIPATSMVAVHAVLPGADWEGIEEHIRATLPEGVDLHLVRAGKTFFEMVERRHVSRPDAPCWPSPSTRQCTSDLKRDPIAKWVRQQGFELVVHCIGIRAEESSSRARAKVWKVNNRETNSKRTVVEWLPIHAVLATEVFAGIARAGQKPHWAYEAGMSRLSCCFCVMASKADLTRAAELRPQLYRQYVELEQRTGWTFSPGRKTLPEITGIE